MGIASSLSKASQAKAANNDKDLEFYYKSVEVDSIVQKRLDGLYEYAANIESNALEAIECTKSKMKCLGLEVAEISYKGKQLYIVSSDFIKRIIADTDSGAKNTNIKGQLSVAHRHIRYMTGTTENTAGAWYRYNYTGNGDKVYSLKEVIEDKYTVFIKEFIALYMLKDSKACTFGSNDYVYLTILGTELNNAEHYKTEVK